MVSSHMHTPTFTSRSPVSHRGYRLILMTLLVLGVWGCSAVQPVRVLKNDEDVITASLGGAYVPNSSPAGLVPYLTAGYATGISDDVTVHGRAHLIMAVFGVAGFDVGASMRAVREDGMTPEVTVSAQLLGFASIARSAPARLYPNLTANASWSISESSLLYIGSHATVQLDPSSTVLSPFCGIQFPISNAIRLQVEGIWQASNVNSRSGIFEGQSSISDHGALGVYLGGMFAL